MTPSNPQRVWLNLLGGKPEHAGLGIFTIAFLVGIAGGAIAFYASLAPERSTLYWLGYTIVVLSTIGALYGITFHQFLRQRRNDSSPSDAQYPFKRTADVASALRSHVGGGSRLTLKR